MFKNRSNFLIVISVITFLSLSCTLIHLIKNYGLRAVNTFVPQTDLIMEIELELTSTHLWLEEYVNGDTTLEVNDILLHLDNVRKYCWLLTEGGQRGDFEIIPLDNRVENTPIENLCKLVRDFDNNVRLRIQEIDLNLKNSINDFEFDKLFNECLKAANNVENELFAEIDKDIKNFDRLQFVLISLLAVVSFFYCLFLVWNNSKRVKALENAKNLNIQLNASNQQLQASEQQLRAINQQFSANEQQLHAANQQLQANEQQLKASNQQLQASEQQLRATNQQLRASEQLLTQNEKKYRSLFENMVEGACLHQIISDDNGKAIDFEILEVNDAYSKIIEKPKHLIINKKGSELSSDGKIPYLPIYGAVAESRKPFFFETFSLDLKKHLSISVYSPSKGKFVTTVTDVTDKKKSEEEIKLLADQNNTILKTINDIIIEIDNDKNIFWGNRAANEFFNDDYIGTQIESYLENKEESKVTEGIEELINNKRYSLNFEETFVNRFNESKRLIWWMTLIHDSNGNVSKLLGTARDVTEQRSIEERLRQSEKMEAIGQLAGGIAHDFNNQLSGMMGYADLLRDEVSDSSELVRFVDNILIAIRRSAELTSQLLAFARKGKYQSISVDIHRIIFETVGILQRSIDKNIHIKQELDANKTITLGDPTQIENALLNLALNARDALNDGGEITFRSSIVTLKNSDCINLSADITPGEYIKISVSDNGSGMDDSIISHIFEPFFTTKELGKGTGMGLAAVYGTMNNHKGAITVESSTNQGTTFAAYFPVHLDQKSMSNENDSLKVQMAEKDAHILFIDDEELICDMASIMFKGLGYKVSVFTDSLAGLDFYKENHKTIDLVILDMVMPIMDGKDLFKAMKSVNPKINSLLASGYSIDGRAQSILNEGVKGFVQKPFRKSEISKIVADTILNGS